MPISTKRTQQLVSTNVTPNIGEALAARTKDPLWYLARQWQTGEFEAENGGRPAAISYTTQVDPFASVALDGDKINLDVAQPLNSVVEAEDEDVGTAEAWRPRSLDYAFDLNTSTKKFSADGYNGHLLDWFHFEFNGNSRGAAPKKTVVEMTPNQMHFRGAPHPRWWRFEEGDAWFDSPVDAEPNVLSLLLPEFFYLDIRNWYSVPASMPSGSVREISNVTVADSFGVVTELNPINEKNWQMFTIDAEGGKPGLGGEFLFAPNIALDVVRTDTLEDVRFIRDESSNMVWAWEHFYVDPETGEPVSNGDAVRVANSSSNSPGASTGSFKLRSETPPYWIPYVPRRINKSSVSDGSTYLRRARTIEESTLDKPQYKSLVVEETARLNEEEVSRTGLRLRRMARYARGSDGKIYKWVGRARESGRTNIRPGLRFDYIDDVK